DKKPIILPTPSNDQHRLIWASKASQRLQKRPREHRRSCCSMSSIFIALATIALMALLIVVSRRLQLPSFSWNRETSSSRVYPAYIHRPPAMELPRKSPFKRPPYFPEKDRYPELKPKPYVEEYPTSFDCSPNTTVNFLKRQQERVDLELAYILDDLVAKLRLNKTGVPIGRDAEQRNTSIIAGAAQAYMQCREMNDALGYYGDSFKVILEKFNFYAPMLPKHSPIRQPQGSESGNLKELLERDALPRLVGSIQNAFGIETLFMLSVAANYKSPDGEQPFMLYLDHNIAKRYKWEESELRDPRVVNVIRLREEMDRIAVQSEDSSKWEEVTVAEATERWPFFDFKVYFTALTMDSPQLRSKLVNDEFMFIVKCPACLNRWDSIVEAEYNMPTGEVHDYLADLIHSQAEDTHIRGYYGIHVDKDSKRAQCASQIRQYLPHVASKLYAEKYPNVALETETKLVRGLKQNLVNALLHNAKFIRDAQTRRLTEEKLRKIGVSFGAPDWLKDTQQFELHHRFFDLQPQQNYFNTQLKLKRFALEQNLLRAINKNGALRSSSFDLTSSADVTVHYSRLGSWIYIPTAVLRLPALQAAAMHSKILSLRAPASPQERRVISRLYASLGWQMGREMVKAIDEEGFRWSVYGVHSFTSDTMEQSVDILRGIHGLAFFWSECSSETKSYWSRGDPTLKITNDLVRDIVGVDAAWEAYIAETVHFTLSLNRKAGQTLQEAKADIGDAFRKEFDEMLCGQGSEVNKNRLHEYLNALYDAEMNVNDIRFGFPKRFSEYKNRMHFH
ncbi:neprilysin, partial [Aphelenchoides avenae]